MCECDGFRRIEVVRIDMSSRLDLSIEIVGCNELEKKSNYIEEVLVSRLLLSERIYYKKSVILLCVPSSLDLSIILTSLGQKHSG